MAQKGPGKTEIVVNGIIQLPEWWLEITPHYEVDDDGDYVRQRSGHRSSDGKAQENDSSYDGAQERYASGSAAASGGETSLNEGRRDGEEAGEREGRSNAYKAYRSATPNATATGHDSGGTQAHRSGGGGHGSGDSRFRISRPKESSADGGGDTGGTSCIDPRREMVNLRQLSEKFGPPRDFSRQAPAWAKLKLRSTERGAAARDGRSIRNMKLKMAAAAGAGSEPEARDRAVEEATEKIAAVDVNDSKGENVQEEAVKLLPLEKQTSEFFEHDYYDEEEYEEEEYEEVFEDEDLYEGDEGELVEVHEEVVEEYEEEVLEP